MKAIIDAERCQGHLRCVYLSEGIFVEDDLGHAEVAIDGDVPVELENTVRIAAANCPESAITLIESNG